MPNAGKGTTLQGGKEKDEIAQKGGDELIPESPKRDARNDKSKLRENREEMGVTDDHKTIYMEKGGRGTFP